MSKVNRFPIEDKLLNQLVAILGKKNADKVARVCRSADFIASCNTPREVADFLGNALTDLDVRKEVANKAWQWAKRLFGEYQDMELLQREHLVDLVGDAYADAVMSVFDSWEQVLAFPSEAEVATLLKDAITDEETQKRISGRLYRYAQRMFATPSPRKQEGGVSVGAGSRISVGGDVVGGNKNVNQ